VRALGLLLVVLCACAPSAAAYGGLTQLPGRDGCTGVFFDECRPGSLGGQRIELSPDQRFAYVVSEEGTVAGYLRNRGNGALRRLPGRRGCVAGPSASIEQPAAAACTEWDLLGPTGDAEIAIAPDGRHVYFGSGGSTFLPPSDSERPAALATLERDGATGQLRPAGCIAQDAAGCAPARAMDRWIAGVAVSPDGRSVYVASSVEIGEDFSSTIAVFARDPVSGALTQLPGAAGCVASEGYPDCLPARGLSDGSSSLVISPDGNHVYLASRDLRSVAPHGGTIAAFARDPATGSLAQLPGESGCLTIDGREGCGSARTLGSWPPNLSELVISPDGRNAYAPFVLAGGLRGGIATFRRDPATGALAQLPGRAGCYSERRMPGCLRAYALWYPTGAAISADGRTVYVSAFNSAAIAVFERGGDGALRQPHGRAACVGGHPGPPIPGPPGTGLFGGEVCMAGPPVHYDVALSLDDSYAYSPREEDIIVFARNGPRIRLRVSPRGCSRSGMRVSVVVSTEGRFRRATVRLDGRVLRHATRRRFGFTIARRRLASRRRHRMSVLAVDARGRRNLRTARLGRCPPG
jgi:6-phosphogluconolactonase (cycloisomerase 2 family)